MKLIVPFGNYAPNAPGNLPGVKNANNVLPLLDSYSAFRNLGTVTNALGGQCLGFAIATASNGNRYTYAGDGSKLYETTTLNTFTDQSVGGGYAVQSGDVWEIVDWARNYKVIATDYHDAVQSMTTGAGASSAFANMITGTNKPKAKHVAVIGQFVVLGYTNDSTDGVRPMRVWWSGIGDETTFDPSAATQSDFEDLATGGQVNRLMGGSEYGLIFQREMVRVMRYVGGTTIFEMLPIAYAPGTPFPGSVIGYGGMVFYIANEGFMMLNGVTPSAIGNNDIDREFWNGISINYQAGYAYTLSAMIDPTQNIVVWAAPNSYQSTAPTKLYIYNYARRSWSTVTQTVELMAPIYADVNGFSTGADIALGAFNSSHQQCSFQGTDQNGTIITSDIQPIPGKRWRLNRVRPLIDLGGATVGTNANCTVSAAPRNNLRDQPTFLTGNAMQPDGTIELRTSGHYQRIRCSFSASFAVAQLPPRYMGLEIDYEIEGER